MVVAILLTLLATGLISWTFYIYQKYQNHWKFIDKFRGPKTLPLIGNGHQLGRNPHDFLMTLFGWWREYGSGCRFWIGHEANIIISDPKDIETILSSTVLLKKSNIYDLLHPWLGEGLLTSTGQKWHSHRKMITPSFHFKILVEFLDVMNTHSNRFIEKLLTKAKDEEIFDFQAMVHYLTLDVICDTAMGVNIDAMNDTESTTVRAFQDMCRIIQMRAFSVYLRNPYTFRLSPEYKIYKKALHELTTFTSSVIAERKKIIITDEKGPKEQNEENIKGKKAFLDTLLTAEIDGRPLTFQEVFEEVSTFMFEGHDTTTSGIVFAIFLLSRHPEIQKKVFDEQKSIYEDNMDASSTYDDMHKMKYLEMFIKEAQRMYPSVPIVGRDPTKNFDLNGKIIPPNTTIMIFIIGMGYNPNVFPEPFKFDPERFHPDKREQSSPYEYVPFSAGPRNCIGQKFAMLELKSVISKVVRKFEILPPIDELVSKDGYQHWHQTKYDPILSTVLTLKSENGVQIRLRVR